MISTREENKAKEWNRECQQLRYAMGRQRRPDQRVKCEQRPEGGGEQAREEETGTEGARPVMFQNQQGHWGWSRVEGRRWQEMNRFCYCQSLLSVLLFNGFFCFHILWWKLQRGWKIFTVSIDLPPEFYHFAVFAFPHVYLQAIFLMHVKVNCRHFKNTVIIQMFLNPTKALQGGWYIPILKMRNLRLREDEYLS